MRSLIVVIILCLTSTPAFACVFHTDCKPGTTCVERAGWSGASATTKGPTNNASKPQVERYANRRSASFRLPQPGSTWTGSIQKHTAASHANGGAFTDLVSRLPEPLLQSDSL
jgi:hypothetical protein